MNEATTIMGGYDNVESGAQYPPACQTGFDRHLLDRPDRDQGGRRRRLPEVHKRQRHPDVNDTALVYVSTPDYVGAFQDGWAKAVTALIEELVEPAAARNARRINALPGCHLTPGDIEELREIIEAFDLQPTFLPDVSGSLDGHMSDEFSPTTMGGTTLEQARAMGAAVHTLAFGEQMRPCALALQAKTGVPHTVLQRLTGLSASDELMAELSRISGVPVPVKYRRQRSQLQDAMLDAHFFIGGKRIVIGPPTRFAVGALHGLEGAGGQDRRRRHHHAVALRSSSCCRPRKS